MSMITTRHKGVRAARYFPHANRRPRIKTRFLARNFILDLLRSDGIAAGPYRLIFACFFCEIPVSTFSQHALACHP
jgi:hypothetical protein